MIDKDAWWIFGFALIFSLLLLFLGGTFWQLANCCGIWAID
jgi:hypothetical protein